MANLRLDKVCKGWDFPVLDEVSLEVAEGEFFVIVGPSGAGKTTMLRLIAGLESPDAGTIHLNDKDVTNIPPYKRGAAMTFESYALYPQLSVFENIASPLRARKISRTEIVAKVAKVAELLHISELLDRKPGEISGGQKQRTALGRTLVATPDVFLLDEPLSHLDAKIRIDLREQFHTLDELRRTATLYVTHDYAEALSLGDRVGVLRDSHIIQVGTPVEIFEHPATIDVAEQFGQPSINLLAAELHSNGDNLIAQAGKTQFTINPAHHSAVSGAGQGLRLGIRPQHIQLVNGTGTYAATVDTFQSLGSYGVLTVDCTGTKLQILAEPEANLRPGDPVSLSIDNSRFIWFAADNSAITTTVSS